MTHLRNTPDDCRWLRETHLRGHNFEFKSFEITGNVDFPDQLVLYASAKPASSERPTVIFSRGAHGLMLQSTSNRAVRVPPKVAAPKAETAISTSKPVWLDFAQEIGCLSDSRK